LQARTKKYTDHAEKGMPASVVLHEDMKHEKILLPIDVARCPLEGFAFLNGFARRPEVTVLLLHVVNLNIAPPENRVFHELAAEANAYLRHLADQHLAPIATTVTHVRIGEPAKEILAEAHAENPDLIILPTYGPSFWNRLKAVWNPACYPLLSPLVEKVIRKAGCGVFVVAAKTRFNCQEAWGRPAREDVQAVPRLVGNHHSPEFGLASASRNPS
jgi:nucleotide-binding universal stress UspA family protein